MPGLSDQQWVVVRQSACLQHVRAEQGVLALRTKITRALDEHHLLRDDEFVADVARRLDVEIGTLMDWAVVANPVERNQRFEVDLRRSFRMANGIMHDGFFTKVVHCSKRHLKDEYYLGCNEETYDSADLNTIAYCSSALFHSGLRYFAEKIADYLTQWERQRVRDPYGAGRTPPRYSAMPRYTPRIGEPEFQSDGDVGNSIHSYCITTPNVAETLDLGIHADLKIVLRGIHSRGPSQRVARAAWARISQQPGIMNVIPSHERDQIARSLQEQ